MLYIASYIPIEGNRVNPWSPLHRTIRRNPTIAPRRKPVRLRPPPRRGRDGQVCSDGSGWPGSSWPGTLLNALGFAYFKAQGRPVVELSSPEILLGDYKVRAGPCPPAPAIVVRFSLHIAFTPQLDQQGRARLAARKHRVEQDIEELLRRARRVDFDDPRLREIKRQIQEQVDETLGMQAVADVIITGLVVEQADRPAAKPAG